MGDPSSAVPVRTLTVTSPTVSALPSASAPLAPEASQNRFLIWSAVPVSSPRSMSKSLANRLPLPTTSVPPSK